MPHSALKGKTRLLFATGALFACCAAPGLARAQDAAGSNSQLVNQVQELQNQVQTLSRAVYKGDIMPAASASGASASGAVSAAGLSDFYSQLTSLQNAQQKLTGEVEKLGFQLQQLTDRVNRMQSDTDERFQQLAQNGQSATTATPSNITATPSGATPAPSGASTPAASTSSAAPSKTLGTLGGDAAPQKLYEDAFADVRNNKYADAEGKFKSFMRQYPGNRLCANAEYWLGEIYYAQGKYKDAARTFAEGYQKYPKSSKAEDSLYKLGLALEKMNRRDDACLSLQQIHKNFPGDAGPLYQKTKAEIKKLNCQ